MYVYVCMYMYMYVYMYMCIFMCMCMCIFMCMYMYVTLCVCLWMNVYVCVCIHVSMYMYVCVCMCMCMYVSMYACMHACMYACMYQILPWQFNRKRHIRSRSCPQNHCKADFCLLRPCSWPRWMTQVPPYTHQASGLQVLMDGRLWALSPISWKGAAARTATWTEVALILSVSSFRRIIFNNLLNLFIRYLLNQREWFPDMWNV
jgi:hypothetical protein